MLPNLPLLYLFSFLFVTIPVYRFCDDCGIKYSQNQKPLDDHAVLIVSLVDGKLQGINTGTGNVIWTIKNPPLVSQSLSNLEFIKDNKKFRLIPSLEGQLYMLEIDGQDNGLRALPITADALFTSTFQLSSDSLLVGGKDQRVFGFNPYTGEVKYRCGKDGCQQDNSFPRGNRDRCDLLICRRISHVVRAVDLDTGMEQWNFSVGQDDVISLDNEGRPHQQEHYHQNYPGPSRSTVNENASNQGDDDDNGVIAHRGCVVVQDDGSRNFDSSGNGAVNGVRWQFKVEAGEVEAIMKPPFNRVLWKQRFSSSLSRVWLVESDTVRQLGLFVGDAKGRRVRDGISYEMGCPVRRSLYLGAFQGQMYVQLEDGNANGAPKPRYISLATTETNTASASSGDMSHQKIVESQINKRHRVSRVTRHELTVHQRGFFRPPIKEMVPISESWFVVDGGQNEYLPPSSEPLVVRYGSFLFQKIVLGCLVMVVSHLIFSNLYLPYYLNKEASSFPNSHHLLSASSLTPIIPLSPSSALFGSANCSLTAQTTHNDNNSLSLMASNSTLQLNNSNNKYSVINNSTNNVKENRQSIVVEQEQKDESRLYESRYATDFEHLRCLGRGAFGVVFEARHRVDQYRYAVKRVRVRYSEEARGKMLKEVQSFAHLEHPGIVRYYQAWFEYPPQGWQEYQDKEMGLDKIGDVDDDQSSFSDSCSDLSSRTNSAVVDMSTNDSRSRSVNDWSLKSLEERGGIEDQDSFVIFDRSLPLSIEQVPTDNGLQRSQNFEENTGPIQKNSGGANRPGAGGNTCSHIYLYISMHLYSSRSLRDWLMEQQQLQFPPRHCSNDNNINNEIEGSVNDQNTNQRCALMRTKLHIFAQIVDAVAYLHSNDLMHRDLKPSNILFDDHNHIRIVDFGLARSMFRHKTTVVASVPIESNYSKTETAESSLSSSSSQLINDSTQNLLLHSLTSNVGTELYMSPEQQQRGYQYDQKVDVFALGIIFIELVVPLATAMERAIVLTKARSCKFDPNIYQSYPREVEFASRLLHHDPKMRPSCEEVFEHEILADVVEEVRSPRSRTKSVDHHHMSNVDH